MTIREIQITYGGKLNLGDYNSAHVEITLSALLDDGEDPVAAQSILFEQAQESVRVKARELFAKRGARVDEIFAGLPVETQKQMGGTNGNQGIN